MAFLDKIGLERLWNHIIVKLNNKADKADVKQSDWNQNDATAIDYVKNRPFYIGEPVETQIVSDTELEFFSVGEPCLDQFVLSEIIEGQTYKVKWNDVEYECVAYMAEDVGVVGIGNGDVAGISGGNNEPFFIAVIDDGTVLAFAQEVGTYTISIDTLVTEIYKIDEKFMPKTIGAQGTGINAEVFNGNIPESASGDYSHAEGYGTNAEGIYSHAEGNITNATNEGSHAEGYCTYARGKYSHAEGIESYADGDYSHAEGKGGAYGEYSHSEGWGCQARGKSTHAEGEGSIAENTASHAEGNSDAKGDYSHSEGYLTIASKVAQHAQGRCNIEDTDTSSVYGKYAHIVGNGKLHNPSNAHTLDWNGLGWFAGGLKVGGTGQDDEAAQEVALKSDIDDISALVGDTSVSEQIAAANMIYVGPDQPTDPSIKVWINTAEESAGVVPVLPRVATITLPVESWIGDASPYYQVVEISTVTISSKVDLQPTAAQIVALQNDDIALMAENENGVVTIHSFGGKPSADMAMQVLLTEVSFV